MVGTYLLEMLIKCYGWNLSHKHWVRNSFEQLAGAIQPYLCQPRIPTFWLPSWHGFWREQQQPTSFCLSNRRKVPGLVSYRGLRLRDCRRLSLYTPSLAVETMYIYSILPLLGHARWCLVLTTVYSGEAHPVQLPTTEPPRSRCSPCAWFPIWPILLRYLLSSLILARSAK